MSFRIEGGALPAKAAPAASEPPATLAKEGPSVFESTLRQLASRVDAGESLVKRAVRSGGDGGLEPGQWIALQAGIYRYVEALDLAAKLVDRAGNAVRTVLQTGH